MFGSKFKTWMENHIVRPKRKNQQEKEKGSQPGGKGPILESSESLAHSDTGVSSGSQQVRLVRFRSFQSVIKMIL